MRQYLRTYRRRAGLTQQDVAALLGWHRGEKVSRYERLTRKPTLETAFACQVIFGVPAHKVFPGVYHEVEQGIRTRARALLRAQKRSGGREKETCRLLRALAQETRRKAEPGV